MRSASRSGAPVPSPRAARAPLASAQSCSNKSTASTTAPISCFAQAPRTPASRAAVEKPAKLPFVALNFHAPNLHHADSAALEMLSGVLSSGKSSRLYQRLVHEQRLALEVDAGYDRTSIDDKTFTLTAQPQPGVPLEKLEAAVEKQIKDLQAAPP